MFPVSFPNAAYTLHLSGKSKLGRLGSMSQSTLSTPLTDTCHSLSHTKRRVHTYATHTPHIHNTYATCTLHIHRTYATHTPHIRHTYAIHTPHIRHTYTTHTPHIRHTYATHTPHIRHTYATHTFPRPQFIYSSSAAAYEELPRRGPSHERSTEIPG